MRDLTERLVDLARGGTGPVRAAAIRALEEAGRVEAAPALIEILRREGEHMELAQETLRKISGRRLPPDPDAWESWHYFATTPVVERETDVERLERVLGEVPDRSRRPRSVPRGGSLAYYLMGIVAAVVGVSLVVAQRVLARRKAAEIGAARRRPRRERREFARVAAAVPVRYRFLSHDRAFTPTGFSKGEARDISGGGIMLAGQVPDPDWVPRLVDQSVFLGVNVELPGEKQPVQAYMRAKWVKPTGGKKGEVLMGLAFKEITRLDQDRIFKFVLEKGLA
jgi:hypothetical protein